MSNEASVKTLTPLARFWRGLKHAFYDVFDAEASLRAAGVAFYAFLSLFPAMAAGLALFSLFFSAEDILMGVNVVAPALPPELQTMVTNRLVTLLYGPKAAGVSLALSIGIAIWSGSRGVNSILHALTLTGGMTPRRSILMAFAYSMLFTFGAFLLVAVLLAGLAVLPLAVAIVPHGEDLKAILALFSWPALVGFNFAAHLVLFRFGPERRPNRTITVWPGAIVATGLWTLGSVLLTLYFQKIAAYDALFGSLAGVAIVMFWFYAMTLFTLFGAKLNSRM
ncbi:MAG: YihY/virulence factor BrkB family protein [Notoacmeibacter sp.]